MERRQCSDSCVFWDSGYTTELVALGTNLAQMAVKGTATAVSAKIRAIKDEKNAEKIRNTYDEIVNELLSEREEAIRIAQAYKSELEKVVISDEDIQHLHNIVSLPMVFAIDMSCESSTLYVAPV